MNFVNAKVSRLGLCFELNENDKTASIISSSYANGSITIPRSIKYNSTEYIVRYIKQCAFRDNKNIKCIDFPDDSELFKIEQNSFINSSIESLTIPPNLKELEEGWCNCTKKLKNIKLSPQNKNFITNEKNDLIFGKSKDSKSDEYDILLYANRGIEHAIIPSFVKIIGSHSFCNCNKIKSIEFSEDSKLHSINSCAFYNSSVKSINFPQNLEVLNKGWCNNLNKLTKISIDPNNRNFSLIRNNRLLVGKSDKNSENFNVLLYAFRDTNKIEIPSCIKYIGSFAFHHCKQLKSLIFNKKSELISIGDHAFTFASIEKVFFPSKLEEICDFAFGICNKLNIIKFPKDSIIHTIGNNAFKYTDLQDVFIPSSVKIIGNSAFEFCKSLEHIEFEEKSKLEIIGEKAFYFSMIEFIKFPSSLIEIGEECFANCFQLTSVEFSQDSNLKTIRKAAFSNTIIESISIPSTVQTIEECAFDLCFLLKSINFPENSELRSFEPNVFSETIIDTLSIPPKLIECKSGWCANLLNLKTISIINNERFKFVDEKFLVFKTDEKSDTYNSLLFVCKDVQSVVVPSYIQRICSRSFQNCDKLTTIEFEQNSQLKIIEDYSFAQSSVELISLPPTVESIGEFAFYICYRLRSIQNFENLKIKTIENNTFSLSKIENLSFPSKFIEFKERWCVDLNLKRIVVSSDNPYLSYINDSFLVGKTNQNINIFDVLLFARRDITHVIIPSFIKIISPFAFNNCYLIKSFEFEENSQLISIEKNAFNGSSIIKISITSSVEKIDELAFRNSNLKLIEFKPTSKLTSIGKNAFSDNQIDYLKIPSSVNYINENAFYNNRNLTNVEILSNYITIENSVFDFTSLSILSFPNVQKITNFNIFLFNFQIDIVVFVKANTKTD